MVKPQYTTHDKNVKSKYDTMGVMIGRCSPNNQHRRPIVILQMLTFFFRYKNDDLRNHTNQRRKHKTWTREDNQFALDCYFRSKPTQRRYRKRMIEIWQECATFQTTSQRHADQVWTMIKKGWFSDLEILEIHWKINNEQDYNTISDTPSIDNQEQSNRNESPTSENRNANNQTTKSKH